MSGHEQRGCYSCNGYGYVALGATEDPMTREMVQELAECWICRGWGKVPLFLYAPPTTSRKVNVRSLDDDAVWRLAWVGSAREKVEAEREVRRRQSRGQ